MPYLRQSPSRHTLAVTFENERELEAAEEVYRRVGEFLPQLIRSRQHDKLNRVVEALLPEIVPSRTALVLTRMQADAKTRVLESRDYVRSANIAEMAGYSENNPGAQTSKWKREGLTFTIEHNGIDYFSAFGLDPEKLNLVDEANPVGVARWEAVALLAELVEVMGDALKLSLAAMVLEDGTAVAIGDDGLLVCRLCTLKEVIVQKLFQRCFVPVELLVERRVLSTSERFPFDLWRTFPEDRMEFRPVGTRILKELAMLASSSHSVFSTDFFTRKISFAGGTRSGTSQARYYGVMWKIGEGFHHEWCSFSTGRNRV